MTHEMNTIKLLYKKYSKRSWNTKYLEYNI